MKPLGRRLLCAHFLLGKMRTACTVIHPDLDEGVLWGYLVSITDDELTKQSLNFSFLNTLQESKSYSSTPGFLR